MGTCCFCTFIKDVKPAPLNPHNPYQQVEICPYEGACNSRGDFVAKPVAADGFPRSFLRRKGWQIQTSTPRNFDLTDALGIDGPRRARLPSFEFPLSQKSSEAVVVGKWYCPFMFVKEGNVKEQVKSSMYYEMTLEQMWEKVWECGKGDSVGLDCFVRTEVANVVAAGSEGEWVGNVGDDGFVWFSNVGLSLAIVERMKWEEERAGWVGGNNRQVRVQKVKEEIEGGLVGGWSKLGFYVLVERFVLRRMGGSLVLSYDFKHTQQIRSKWE